MSKKLYSFKSEMLAIKTICSYGDSRPGQYLLAKLKEDYFATEIGRATFKRILYTMKKAGTVPDWTDLLTDPGIDETIRDSLDEVTYEPLSDKSRIQRLVTRLNDYRKNRVLLDIGKLLDKKLNTTEPLDTDDVIKQIQDKLSGSTFSSGYKTIHIGEKANADKFVDKILSGTAISYVPTGFDGFDNKNRGFSRGSAVIIAGETGSGKTMLIGSLTHNMALSGAKVAMIPLEMTNEEVLERDLARTTTVTLNDLLDPQNKISKKVREDIKDRFRRHSKRIARHGGRISYFEFDNDVSIESILSTVQPFGYDVVIIDYIGLLEGMSGDRQWQTMMDAVRYAKVWAKNTGAIVILAAQLSKEGMLKYSRGMMDHANNAWIWANDDLFKTTNVATIKQPKARKHSDHEFLLYFDKPKALVRDADEKDIAAYNAGMKSRSKDGKKRKRWEEEDGDNTSWDDDKPKKYTNKDREKEERHPSQRAKKVVEI